ncbi:MAG: maltose ABC transporter substrate-binding protein [Spirochaetaceae bacterium]|jgi:arabinogalactan oligomer/maltooligosaccharide transport system substrate-binding protein|nr:maltose ABC transporter substrate-binding protein [Spirochaetaceae bacterium]
MKRTIAALGAALMVLGACTKSDSSGGTSSGTAAQTGGSIRGELTVWLDNDDWAEAVIAGFNQKYPEVAIHYEKVGSVDARGKVSLDGPAGIGPDVFIMPHDHVGNAILDGLCEPFSPELKQKYEGLLLPAALNTAVSDGEVYALPISTENIAFFYNKDLLGGAAVPKTFEEIIAFAETWNNAVQNKYALRWQVDDSYINYFFLTAFGMNIFGPNHDDYKNPGFDSNAVRQGIEFHNSLRKTYNVNVADATWDNTVAMFQRGEVPFTISGPWAIGDAKKNNVNFGIVKLPTIAGNQPRCFSGNILAAVSSYTNNPEAAFAFVEFLAGVEGATIQYNTTGKLTALKDISSIPGLRDDPYLAGIQEQAPFADPMPTIPEVNQMWDSLKTLFTFTWDGQLSPQAAQEKAMKDYDAALEMAGKSR